MEEPKQPLIPFGPVRVRARSDGWTVKKQYAFIEALTENDRASLAGGKAAQGMSPRIVARSLSGGQARTTMAGTSAHTRVGWLRLLRFDLPSRARARARARVPLPTSATFVPRKARRHCEHSRRFEMWSRAWAR